MPLNIASLNVDMVMATDGVRKVVVEANLGTPLQAFNLRDDSNEDANLVASEDLDEGFRQLLEDSIGPYLAARAYSERPSLTEPA